MGCGVGDFNSQDCPEAFGMTCHPCRRKECQLKKGACMGEKCPCKHKEVGQAQKGWFDTPNNIVDLVQKLEEAKQRYVEAERAETAARAVVTEATNTLNTIQKQIDAWYKAQRESAVSQSEWYRQVKKPAER